MKSELRKKMLEIRKNIPQAMVQKKSNTIQRNAVERLSNIRRIHIYYPFRNEVLTFQILEFCWKNKIEVQVPRTNFKQKNMTHYIVHSYQDFEKTKLGMFEPLTACKIALEAPEIIFVPGVAFDKENNRMGYGGGFYDRFLQQTPALKIALAFSEQIMDKIPTEEHDIKMDLILSDY